MKRHNEWTFDDRDLVKGFDQYVRGQLPFYDLATLAVADLVRAHLPQNGLVVDIGASTGNVGRAIAATLDDRSASLIAVEPSAEMRAVYSAPGTVEQSTADDFLMPRTDVIVSFLTLGFVTPALRRPILKKWIAQLRDGGVIIAVERVAVERAPVLCRQLIHAAKVRSGVSESDVLGKEIAILGVLRPLHPDLLPSLGGALFFAYGDFRGYVIGGDQHERR